MAEYSDNTITVLDLVASERGRQERLAAEGKHAYSCADPRMTDAEVLTVLAEEVGEAAHEVNEGIGEGRSVDKHRLMKELIQIAAVSVGWAERVYREINGTTDIETTYLGQHK